MNAPTNVQITYTGTAFTVTFTQGANTFSESLTSSNGLPAGGLAALGPTAFMGFTGGTGEAQRNR